MRIMGVVIHTTLKAENRDKFTGTKVPRQCPLVLLVKVGWRRGKTFGSEESTEIIAGEKLIRVLLHSIRIWNSDIRLCGGGAVCGEILMLTWY
jgi:hypothetical protein